jgi:hypothetical protein
MPCSNVDVHQRFGEHAASMFRVLTDDGENHKFHVLILLLLLSMSTAVLGDLQHATSLIPKKGENWYQA